MSTDFENPRRRFCALLDEAMRDEAKTPSDYTNLILSSTNVDWNLEHENPKKIFEKVEPIIRDEERHLRSLEELQRKFCSPKAKQRTL